MYVNKTRDGNDKMNRLCQLNIHVLVVNQVNSMYETKDTMIIKLFFKATSPNATAYVFNPLSADGIIADSVTNYNCK